MNMHTTGPAAHLGDDELLRLMDRDGDAGWLSAMHGHVQRCDRCARELDALSGDALFVRGWLEAAAFEADLPPAGLHAAARRDTGRGSHSPARTVSFWPESAWLRAAAVLLVMAAPVAALPELREWIATAVTGSAEPAAEGFRTMDAPAAAHEAPVIRFAPVGAAFSVAVDVPQAAGVLHVRQVAEGDEAVFEAIPAAGSPLPVPVVAESSLRLRNSAGTSASYSLLVPAGISRVDVSVGGVTVASISGAALRDGVEVPLRSR
jgi:hypothetical protein